MSRRSSRCSRVRRLGFFFMLPPDKTQPTPRPSLSEAPAERWTSPAYAVTTVAMPSVFQVIVKSPALGAWFPPKSRKKITGEAVA